MTSTRLAIALLGATAAVASMPTAALAGGAKTYCVNDNACVFAGGEYEGASIQSALNDAAAHPGPDHVKIAAGVYTDGPYTYVQSSNPVDITGAGPNSTIVSLAPGSKSSYIVDVGAAATISNLTVTVPSQVGNITALALTQGSTAEHVVVNVGGDSPKARGIDLSDGGALRDVQVHARYAPDAVGIAAGSTLGPAELSDVRVEAATGLLIGGTGPGVNQVRRLVATGSVGVRASCGHTILEDSLIVADTDGVAAKGCSSKPAVLDVRQSTVVGGGQGVDGAKAMAGGSESADLTLSNSIVHGFKTDLRQAALLGAHAGLATSFSAYNPARVSSLTNGAGSSGALVQANRIDAAPGFEDGADGDFRLRAESPLVNAGDPAGLAQGESATDVAGNPRIVNGRRDVGAYENQQAPVPAGPPSGPGTGTSATPSDAKPAAPHLVLKAAKRQRLGKRGSLALKATADQDAGLQVTGTVTIAGLRKALKLKSLVLTAAAGRSTRVTLVVGRAARKALKRGAKVTAIVNVTATAAGGSVTATRKLKLAL